MAAITQVQVTGVNTPVTATRTVMSASDTLTYSSGTGQKLVLFNTTASPITLTITGASATTVSPAGLGGTVSVASGFAVTVGASATVVVQLDAISAYLIGAITATGGVGLTAHLYA